jgi:hypothetical protein
MAIKFLGAPRNLGSVISVTIPKAVIDANDIEIGKEYLFVIKEKNGKEGDNNGDVQTED